MENTIIQLKNVCKTFQTNEFIVKALDNVSFDIQEGELVVILGASGAGKTTLLNLLGGMDSPTSGEITVNKQHIENYTDKQLVLYRRNKIGFVFQFYNLISNLTALDNVQFASSYVENSLDAKETLNKVGLKERYYNFPSQLSGGEQQRVAIARAVAKNPLILLCDEPTGALDSVTGREVLQLLYDINQNSKKTIFIITHNAEIAKIADKVIQIKNGKIDKLYKNDIKVAIDELEW
mgnify:FL=1|jgi:ABC transporter, ATP-binding protein